MRRSESRRKDFERGPQYTAGGHEIKRQSIKLRVPQVPRFWGTGIETPDPPARLLPKCRQVSTNLPAPDARQDTLFWSPVHSGIMCGQVRAGRAVERHKRETITRTHLPGRGHPGTRLPCFKRGGAILHPVLIGLSRWHRIVWGQGGSTKPPVDISPLAGSRFPVRSLQIPVVRARGSCTYLAPLS